MQVLVLCLKAFETMEFSVFIDIFGWARDDYACDIHVTTCGFQPVVESTFHIPVQMDRLIDDIDVSAYDALAIPGGFQEYGFYEEAYDEKTLSLIRQFHQAGKPIASVCVAAFPLARSGILVGKRGTTYHLRGGDRQRRLASMGVDVVNQPIVIDDQIITSYCPQTASEVAFQLLRMLTNETIMKQVKEAMGFDTAA